MALFNKKKKATDAKAAVVAAETPLPEKASPNTPKASKSATEQPVGAATPVEVVVAETRPHLEQGDSGDAVRELQEAMRAKGFRLKVDGQFSLIMKQALIQYQGNIKIPRTGAADAATWAALTTEEGN